MKKFIAEIKSFLQPHKSKRVYLTPGCKAEWIEELEEPRKGKCKCGAEWLQLGLSSLSPELLPQTIGECLFCQRKENVESTPQDVKEASR